MKGIVTADDIVDVVQSEATEDIQKLGGMEALDTPYMRTGLAAMVKKRAGWLSALFLGEMLTASAMGHYEVEIARAVVLALFVPLIISSGGNSGSQATTLIIRAMALGEVGLRDWWRIMRREIGAGLSLGLILATLGFIRIVAWQLMFGTYGAKYAYVAASVAVSLVGVVTWGTVMGSMLPFVIRRFGFDPASASAPFVATLVDVSGLMIYFNVARLILGGVVL
jgi:magnesium transporter